MKTPQIDALFAEVAALRNEAASLRANYDRLNATHIRVCDEAAQSRQEKELLQKSFFNLNAQNVELPAKIEHLKKSREDYSKAAKLHDELILVRAELEKEQMRLAAVGVVACADTEFSRAKAREIHPDYRSPGLGDVERRVDECIELRAKVKELEKRINERYSDANYHMNAIERLCAFVKPKDATSEGVVQAAIDWIKRLIEDHEKDQAVIRELTDWKNGAMIVDQQIMSIDRYVRNHPDSVVGDNIWTNVGRWLRERDYLIKKINKLKEII